MTWSEDGEWDGLENMRRDRELLGWAELGSAVGRIYTWNVAWVSLGRFQRPGRAIGPGCKRYVIRPTGGRAVLHGHDVTLGAAAPLALLGLADSRSIKPVYQAMVAPIVAALRGCGLPAALGNASLGSEQEGKSSTTGTQDCFSLVSPYDIVHETTGAKLCGCAMRVTQNAALLQVSIPFEAPDVTTSEWIHGGSDFQPSTWNRKELLAQLKEAYASLAFLAE